MYVSASLCVESHHVGIRVLDPVARSSHSGHRHISDIAHNGDRTPKASSGRSASRERGAEQSPSMPPIDAAPITPASLLDVKIRACELHYRPSLVVPHRPRVIQQRGDTRSRRATTCPGGEAAWGRSRQAHQNLITRQAHQEASQRGVHEQPRLPACIARALTAAQPLAVSRVARGQTSPSSSFRARAKGSSGTKRAPRQSAGVRSCV